MTGIAVDLGRMYVAKNETQAYVDSAALAAVLELDGTADGVARAQGLVAANGNRWNFHTSSFNGTITEFSTNQNGPWEGNPPLPLGYRFVRVGSGVSVPLSFIRAVVSQSSSLVRAVAVAGQELRNTSSEGACPFSPLAHNNVGPHFGLTPGVPHTLRWAANPKISTGNVCDGDAIQSIVDLSKAGGGSERGYIEDNSAAVIRNSIVYGYQTEARSIGDHVVMTGGAKQTQRDAIQDRIGQDSDQASATYAGYKAGGGGNGRRVLVCPINTGFPDNTIVQYAGFFLQTAPKYPSGGNKPFCAEYIGPYLQGTSNGGAGGAADSGLYVGRLFQ